MEFMQNKMCVDPTVGDILSGWRYDISGIHFEMRRDYEEHFRNCAYCRSRQRLHRAIDMVLMGMATLSIGVFLLALAVLHKVEPLGSWVLLHLQLHQVSLAVSVQGLAVLGLLVSLMAWVLVAIATPAPTFLSEQAKALQEKIPEGVRERLPKFSA
jgi:lipopolysaccharide/colanic/teichoic acid biosynthesis glycosyltransferase